MALFHSNTERFAFQNFANTLTDGDASPYHFNNYNVFSSATFRLELDSPGGTVSFEMSIDQDTANYFNAKVFHIEANDFVQSVGSFSSGHFVATLAGISVLQISATAGAIIITGRATRDGLGAIGFSGLGASAYTDGIEVLNHMDGSGDGLAPSALFLRRTIADFTISHVGTFSITEADGAAITEDATDTEDMAFSFRNVSNDLVDYVSPEMRPVLKMVAVGTATISDLHFGFSIDISAFDFTDVIGIGFEVYCESDFDYECFAGDVDPDLVARNYKRFTMSIRDSSDVILWQAEKLDCSFGTWDIADKNQYRIQFPSTDYPGAAAGSWALTAPNPRLFTTDTVSTWTAGSGEVQPRGMLGNESATRDAKTQYRKFEFSLQRENVQDSFDAFYLTPRSYPIQGNPGATSNSIAGQLLWDFSTADTLYIYTDVSANDGTDLASDVTLLGGTPDITGAETQRLYFKNVFIRRRPYDYTTHHPDGYGADIP